MEPSLRHPNPCQDGGKNHSHWIQTFGDGIKVYSRHRGSNWAKPCSTFLHFALELRKIPFEWECSFKTRPSPAVTGRDWQNSRYYVAVRKHWQKGGDGRYRLVAVNFHISIGRSVVAAITDVGFLAHTGKLVLTRRFLFAAIGLFFTVRQGSGIWNNKATVFVRP